MFDRTSRLIRALFAAAMLIVCQTQAAGKLNVVATLPDLASITRIIGGDLIKLTSLANPSEDPHFVSPRPSFTVVLNQADVLIEGGADLESGWLPPLVQNSRNRRIQVNSKGRIIASRGVPLIDVPVQSVDRSSGDVHLAGNPHYLLAPQNAKTVARTIATSLGAVDPEHAQQFTAQLQQFERELDQSLARWQTTMAPFQGVKVITYHRTFDYLLRAFGLELAGTIEPKPGIEPAPKHIQQLMQQGKKDGVKLIIIEPSRNRKTALHIAEAIDASLLMLPAMPGTNSEGYLQWLDANISAIASTLSSPQPQSTP